MKLIPRKGIRLGLVAGLVATGLVGVTSLAVSGEPRTEDVGVLKLTVADGNLRTGTVKYFADGDTTGTADATQNLSAVNACTTITSQGAPLLQIAGGSADSIPVLPGNGLGLLTGNQNCGTSGVIDRNEVLRLKLDGLGFPAGVKVSATTLFVINPDGAGGNLRVGTDGDEASERSSLTQVSPNLVAGLNEITVGGFADTLILSSTSPRFNKGLLLKGATFTLVKDIPNQAPTAAFTPVPAGLDVQFNDNSTDADGTVEGWSWNFGDGNTSTLQSPKHTYAGTGKYTVTLTVTDNLDLASTTPASQEVDVKFTAAVFCSKTVEGTPSLAATSGIFTRVENGTATTGNKVERCEDVGVTVKIENDSIFWDNDSVGVNGNGQDVRGLFEITWTGVAPSAFPVEQERRRYINYQGETTGAYFPIQWCTSFTKNVIPAALVDDPATPNVDERRERIIVTATQPDGPIGVTEGTAGFDGVVKVTDWTDTTKYPAGTFVEGTVPWCLVENSEVLDGAVIVQTQLFYGAGDPRTPLAR